jgi:hypothetical protein
MARISISISVTRGEVGAHFSEVSPGFRRIVGRDDVNPPRITSGNPWKALTDIPDTGSYVLDLPDWDDDPDATVELAVNGNIVWQARGSSGNYNGWNITVKAQNVRITDDREICIDL